MPVFFSEKHADLEITWKNFVATIQATYESIKGRI